MVSGLSGGLHRLRQALGNMKWPLTRSTSPRDGKGTVIFSSTDEVLPLVYRPNLSVRDVCREAAIKVNISPVALDFFTLVSEDGTSYLDPNTRLCEAECNRTYRFQLCFKACHVAELKDLDKQAFEYYFHQCRQDFLRGRICDFGNDWINFAKAILYEIAYTAKQKGVSAKALIKKLPRSIESLLETGVFREYPFSDIKIWLKDTIVPYEDLRENQIKLQYIVSLEGADDFFAHKLSFEKIYMVENKVSLRKFDVLVSAEFGIKKRRTDCENNCQQSPEVIVDEFSEVEGLELDITSNEVKILRTNRGPEMKLKPCSPQAAHSLLTLIEGYYRLMVNQYKQLTLPAKETKGESFCHGPILRCRAEYILENKGKKDGLFLIRKSRENHLGYTLSLCFGNSIKHYKIKKSTFGELATFCLESDSSNVFPSLLELIEHYKNTKDQLPVSLSEICQPETEGLSALLDRASLKPPPPDIPLVDPSVKISLDDLKCDLLALTKGEFGELKKGSWKCPSAEGLWLDVFLRALVKPVGRMKTKEFQKAMSTFLELKHQHLIQLYGITEAPKALNFVFEFAADSLDVYIKTESEKSDGISKGRVLLYAAQIAEGMMFLHSKNIVHGRLRADNVLVSSEDFVKIGDYGLLHLVNNGQIFHESKTEHGYSYCWFSPLALENGAFNFEDDIWSFGMTLWEMLTMKKPYHCSLTNQVLDKNQVLRRYLEQKFPNLNRPNIPPKVRECIQSCWEPRPEDRPDFESLVFALRSADLVSEKEAGDILVTVIGELEDWEIPTVNCDQLELQKRRADSEVSNVADYSFLSGNQTQANASVYAGNLPGITVNPSASLFNTSIFRKQSGSKNFSHPDLIRRLFESGMPRVSMEAADCLAPRKPSFARASSCPPAIQGTFKGPDDCPEQTTEPEEPTATRGQDEVENEDKLLPFVPFLPSLESQIMDISIENTSAIDTEEFSEDADSCDNSDSECGESTGHCAETLAMRALGGMAVKASGTPPNFASDERNFQLSEHGLSSHSLHSNVVQRVELRFETSVVSPGDEHHFDETSDMEDSNHGEVDGDHAEASLSPSNQGTGPPPNGKLEYGPHVKVFFPQVNSEPEGSEHDAIARLSSPLSSVRNEECSSSGYARINVWDPEKVVSTSNKDASSGQIDDSPKQTFPPVTESPPLQNELASKADEFLASFTNVSSSSLVRVCLSEFSSDVEEDDLSGEGLSTLITDLRNDSENSDTDSLSRDDAESSLCRMFVSGRNRALQENTKDCKFSGPGFELDITFDETPGDDQEDEEDCFNIGRPQDSDTLPEPFLNSDELITPELQLGGHVSQESLESPFFDCNAFLSTIAASGELEKSAEIDKDQDKELEHLETMEFPLNNLSKECMKKSTELLFFKDNPIASQLGLDLNQGDDACSYDGYPLDPEHAPDGEGNCSVPETSSSNTYNVNADGRLKEVSSSPGHFGGDGHASGKEQPLSNVEGSNGYQPTKEKEPIQPLSLSSSSDGFWPSHDMSGESPRRKSTNASCSSWDEGEKPIQLDMSEIPVELQIPYEQLQVENLLGKGNFGEVRKATWIRQDSWNLTKKQEVAVKVLKSASSDRNSSDFIKEIRNMVELKSKKDCPFIIRLCGVSQAKEGKIMLVTELAPLGALLKYLPKNEAILGTKQLLNFCMQICQGMAYLEQHKLLHRDLAARNILVMTEEQVKISDFGLSRLQEYYKLQPESNEQVQLPVKWYALESLTRQSFTSKSDVWSFGITMWEIFTYGREIPYKDIKNSEVVSHLEQGHRLGKPDKCPEKVFEIMKSCWDKDPIKRASFYLLEKCDLKNCLDDAERRPQLC